jgi:hypothetical protein
VHRWTTASFLCLPNSTSWRGLKPVANTFNSDTASCPTGPDRDSSKTAGRVRDRLQLYQSRAQLSLDPRLIRDSLELREGCAERQNCIGRLRSLGVRARQRRYSTRFGEISHI